MAEEQSSVRPSSTPAPMAMPAPTRVSPASDADGVEPASPEPMDTASTPEPRPADADTDAERAALDAVRTNKPASAPVRRRNRPALSCIQCRTRKVRCDRNEPCNSCIKSKIVNCTYEEARRPKPKFWRLSPGNSPAPGQTGAPNPHAVGFSEVQFAVESNGSHRAAPLTAGPQYPGSAGASVAAVSGRATDSPSGNSAAYARLDGPSPAATSMSSSEANALASRVKELEEKLAEALKRQDGSHAASPELSGTVSKTRYFGASHWINKAKHFPLIMSLAERIESEKNSEIYQVLDKCKKLARLIKARRTPSAIAFETGKALPPEPIAFRLVEAYFRTFETVYRVIHVPSFWSDYRKFWSRPSEVDRAFVIQLQLCMAIGTCFQDDIVNLRPSATQWIYEAQYWLASPFEKSRMNISGLQIMCLLHLAREACGVGGDLTWISLGATLRTAMFMGIHRDPDHLPPMPLLAAELRRRLWATISEFVLQSSLGSGGPPLLSQNDYDTRAPSNYDDDQLVETTRFSSGPRPPGTFTQTSVQIALAKSFATRLSIAQYVNDIHATPSYDETLRRNSELTVACRTLSATLQPSYDPAGVIPNRVSLFQLQMTEHMMHRFFFALNATWMRIAQNNPAYYFARKMSVEVGLKLFRACAKGCPAGEPPSVSQATDFTKLAVSGAGAFRAVPMQALTTICVELLWQSLEERTFRQTIGIDQPGLAADTDGAASGAMGSGVASRSELLEALSHSGDWAESRVRRGETNVKGYIFQVALTAQIDATQRGANDAEVERLVLDKALESCHYSLAMLKELAGGNVTPSDLSDFASVSGSSGPDGNRADEFGFGINTNNDWGWVWDDMGFNLNNFNPSTPDIGFGNSQ